MSSWTSKESKVNKLMASFSPLPTPSDEYVANILADEASRRKQLYEKIGIAAYKGSLPKSAPKEVNKTFLANIIRHVDSHNRREEIEECWRMKRVNSRDRRRVPREHKSSNRVDSRGCVHESNKDEDDERSYWAAQKAKKMKTSSISDSPIKLFLPATQSQDEYLTTSIDQQEQSISHKSRSKDKEKSKKSKKDKKKKKSKKHKKEKCSDDVSIESNRKIEK